MRSPRPYVFTGKFWTTFKDIMPIFLRLFQKIEEGEALQNSFYIARITGTKPEKTSLENQKTAFFICIGIKIFNKILINKFSSTLEGSLSMRRKDG